MHPFWEELYLVALRRIVKAITHSLHIATISDGRRFRYYLSSIGSSAFGCSVPGSSRNLEEVGEDDTLVLGDNGEPRM